MPNIASVLREEITRLARKEVRSETESLKKMSGQYRSDIAALKRRVAILEKQLSKSDKKNGKEASAPAAADVATGIRFSASGLSKHRQRLGLSAAGLGALLGVSPQTIYNWEAGSTRPRGQQLAALAEIRRLGKREVSARLMQPA